MRSLFKFSGVLALGVVIGGVGGFFLPSVLKHSGNPHQPYADQQGRTISSLSASDVEALSKGNGWGLAKPAEFNGFPGPAHVIEFADQLELDAKQKVAVKDAFDRMKVKAIELGQALIEAEKALDAAFVEKSITRDELDALLNSAEKVRAQLRSVHLSAHLEVTPLLNEQQKLKYASLRGYGNGHGGH